MPCMAPRHGILVVALAACAGATSGETHPASPPTSRTIDSTGPVDNAGRTSDEVIARPETAGVRPTELGSNRPTGTNTGFPNGARTGPSPEPPPTPRGALLLPREGGSPIAAFADQPGRVGRAFCDREEVCARVG